MNTEMLTKMLSHIRGFINQEMSSVNKRFDELPVVKEYDDKGIYSALDDVRKSIDELPVVKEYDDTIIYQDLAGIRKGINDNAIAVNVAKDAKVFFVEEIRKTNKTLTDVKKSIDELPVVKEYDDKDIRLLIKSFENTFTELMTESDKANEQRIKELQDVEQARYVEFEEKMLASVAGIIKTNENELIEIKSQLANKDAEFETYIADSLELVNDSELKMLSKLETFKDTIETFKSDSQNTLNELAEVSELKLHKLFSGKLLDQQDTINGRLDSLKGKTGKAGKQGKPGLDYTINFFDAFDKERGYDKNDSVLFNDNRYVSIIDKNTDGIPSPKWRKLIPCMQGKQGPRGEKGDVGLTGKRGDKGDDGKSVDLDILRDTQIIEENKNGG